MKVIDIRKRAETSHRLHGAGMECLYFITKETSQVWEVSRLSSNGATGDLFPCARQATLLTFKDIPTWKTALLWPPDDFEAELFEEYWDMREEAENESRRLQTAVEC